MIVKGLKLSDFRNLTDVELSFDPGLNVIYGENAQGKTNLLEAVYYFSVARPRSLGDKDCIRWGCEQASLTALFHAQNREQTLEASLSCTKRRMLKHNGVTCRSPQEWMGLLPAVFFGPEELSLIKAGGVQRRRFLDMALCQLRPRYLKLLADYKRIHSHKTRILRDGAQKPSLWELLPDFNEKLCHTGAAICAMRAAFCERIAPLAAAYHADISGGREQLTLRYQPSCEPFTPDAMARAITQKYAAEKAARVCLIGPHRDDWSTEINGKSVKTFGSQGQTRTAALSVKLAERDLFHAELLEPPLLLLDDVLSELDDKRQGYILEKMSGGQCFLTCCGFDGVRALNHGRTFHAVKGSFFIT